MSEQQMLEMVQPLVDGEEVLAVGMFQPRGTSGAMDASGAAGLGTNDVAGMAIDAIGMIGAGHAAAMVEHQPRWTMLTVTPTRVIAFEGLAKGIGWKPGPAYATFDRAHLAATIHGRVNVRVLVLDDLADHRRLELETARFCPQHGTVVLHLLGHGDHDPDPGEPSP